MDDMLNRTKVLCELRKIQMSPYFQSGHCSGNTHEMDLYLERLMLMQRIYDVILTMKPANDTREVELNDAV